MKTIILTASVLGMTTLLSPEALAADACEVVLCMYGKVTGNSSNECQSAERAFFNIVKKNRYRFLPGPTANARKNFLLECQSADPVIISQIISKFGRLRW